MSSKKAKETVSAADAAARKKELAKELVKFRVSLDPSVIQSGKGPVQLRRELRTLGRAVSANQKKK
ncbi:MAG: hypothetical protein FJY29_07675 [Betaproteobacteria bacterium]|nr:hypothetical protein [Betaproteobacteria bacterium]